MFHYTTIKTFKKTGFKTASANTKKLSSAQSKIHTVKKHAESDLVNKLKDITVLIDKYYANNLNNIL